MTKPWIDLSHVYHPNIPPSRIKPEADMRIETLREVDESRGIANTQRLTFLSHQGTHIDAPRHVLSGAPTLDQIPLDRFYGEGVVARIDAVAGEEITAEKLAASSPPLRPGDFLFIATGWDKYYASNDEQYYINPYLAVDAAEWIVTQRITMVGMDTLSLDMPASQRPPDFRYPAHQCLIRSDVLIVENLTNLACLAGLRVEVMALPIAIRGADGAPARVVARKIGDSR